MDENGASRRADRLQGSHPGLCRWGHQKPDCVGCCPSPSAPPCRRLQHRREEAHRGQQPNSRTYSPKSQMPRANPVRVALQCTSHREMTQDTSGMNNAWGLQQGARTPSSLTYGLGGDSFPTPHELGWQGAAPSPPCPVSQGQLSSEPLGAAPGAALRAAHTGARGLGAPRDPHAGLWGAAGSVLRQRLGRKKVFPSLGFCYVFSQETPKRSS